MEIRHSLLTLKNNNYYFIIVFTIEVRHRKGWDIINFESIKAACPVIFTVAATEHE
jgi:hypothetical protein